MGIRWQFLQIGGYLFVGVLILVGFHARGPWFLETPAKGSD